MNNNATLSVSLCNNTQIEIKMSDSQLRRICHMLRQYEAALEACCFNGQDSLIVRQLERIGEQFSKLEDADILRQLGV